MSKPGTPSRKSAQKAARKAKPKDESVKDDSSGGGGGSEDSNRSMRSVSSLSIVDDPETPSSKASSKIKAWKATRVRRRRQEKRSDDESSDPSDTDEDLPCAKGAKQPPSAARTYCAATLRKGVRGLREEFASVRSYAPEKQSVKAFTDNRSKNRYKDVMCADETRVKLKDGDDYINASYVKGDGLTFICTQGPLDRTVVDFWRMIWQENCSAIIMLCETQEKGRRKSAEYWPREYGKSKKLDGMCINNLQVKCLLLKDNLSVFCTKLGITRGEEKRKLLHYQWCGWPDKSVPCSAIPVIELVKKGSELAKTAPVVVHCTAGVGRTAAFVCIGLALASLEHNENVNGVSLVRQVRNQRLHSIQSELQYLFIHRAIIEHLIEEDQWPLERDVKKFINQYEAYLRERMPQDD